MAKKTKEELKALNLLKINKNGVTDTITASEVREVPDAIIDSYVHLDEIKTINGQSLTGTGNILIVGGVPSPTEVKDSYESNPNTNVFTDAEKIKVSNTSGVNTGDQDLSVKQDLLVSGTNIKTINSVPIVGSGNIVISATTDASDLTSGVLADARVQESNVTQHEAALTITESQISDLGPYAPSLGVDDNYVTDLEKVVIGNTSGTNTGDQDLSGKQDVLISGTNIKTINSTSLLGSGDIVISGTPEGTAILSTGEAGGNKFLREDGDGTSSWQSIPGGGDALTGSPLSQFAATTKAQLNSVISDGTPLYSGDLGALASLNTVGSAQIDGDAVTLAKMQNFTSQTILGRYTAGTANPELVTMTQLREMLNVEDGADVTDTTNVTAAGALMDSEVTNLAQVKAFDSSDYATSAQGDLADSAIQSIGTGRTGVTAVTQIFKQSLADYTSDGAPTSDIAVLITDAPAGVSDPGSNGITVRTALNTLTSRTITGTSNKITVTNGDGVSGNPTLTVGSDIVDKTASTTYTAGAKQIFSESATTAALGLTGFAGHPSSLTNGDIWYRSDTNALYFRLSGATRTFAFDTNTLTFINKRITKRVTTITSSATPTPAGDSSDMFTVTALAADATFAAPTGTPTDGQSLIIRIKDNGTSRTLAWNAIYRAGTSFALPTATVISKTIYLQLVYNSADTVWDAVGLSLGF